MAIETFDYPSATELIEIEQTLMPRLEEGRVGLQLFPTVNVDASILQWEQMDNFQGLQQARGLNGQPAKVQKTGARRFRMDPGYYGEFEMIDEQELTERRKLGTFGQPIDISDLVGLAQRKLLQRRLDRLEYIVWTLLTTGTFTVNAPNSGYVHTDTFPILTATASPGWGTVATATPLKDLRTVMLQQRGQSASFGRSAKVYVNRGTANNLLNNTNANDLGGRYRVDGGNTLNTLEDMNRVLGANDLPSVEVYDAGYLNDAGTFTTFIPDNKGVLIGARPAGQTVGEYRMLRNANNPDLGPGPYTRVIDRGEERIPRTVEIHDGHNGGVVIYYPGAVVLLNL